MACTVITALFLNVKIRMAFCLFSAYIVVFTHTYVRTHTGISRFPSLPLELSWLLLSFSQATTWAGWLVAGEYSSRLRNCHQELSGKLAEKGKRRGPPTWITTDGKRAQTSYYTLKQSYSISGRSIESTITYNVIQYAALKINKLSREFVRYDFFVCCTVLSVSFPI